MKSTTNAFSKGLTTDLYPMQVANTQMTDALNATFLTYNGNEMMLQNDMGNTKILDKNTGAIMGLKEGFVPVGMKEHGGILYIASYNPKKGISELGSIPSPVFNYEYDFKTNIESKNNKLLTNATFILSDPISITNERFSVGDLIFCNFDITEGDSKIVRSINNVQYTYPTISTELLSGLISLHLYADCDETPQTIDLNVHRKGLDSKENRWYHRWDRDKKSITESGTPYQSDDVIINAYEPFENDKIIHYPNFQSGSLSIKSEIEFPHSFRCLENLSTERLEPYYYTDDNNDIWVIIPGIEYVVNGPLWVDKIIINVLNDGVELPLYTANINSPHSQFNGELYSDNYTNAEFKYKNVLNGEESMRIAQTFATQLYENEMFNGGLCAIYLGNKINTTVDIKLQFYTDVSYTSSESIIDKYVYNKQYYANTLIASNNLYIKVGELEISYNPLTPSVLGNVEIKLADSTPLEIVHGKNTEIDIDFNCLIKGSESKSKEFKLGEFLGPLDGLSKSNSKLACNGTGAEKPAILRLINQIPKITTWLNSYKPGLDYKLWILGERSAVNTWYKLGSHNALSYFCSRSSDGDGTRSDTQYYTLCAILNDSIEYPMMLSSQFEFTHQPIKDLHVFYNSLGTLTITCDSNVSSKNVIIDDTIASQKSGVILLNHAFNVSDSVLQDLISILNQNAFLYLWEPSKIEGSIDIYPYVFGWHSEAANLIEYSDPILTEEYKNSPSVVINLDAPYNIVDKLDVDFSYRKISNLTYCIPAACWEKQNTKDLGLTGADSQGVLKTNTNVEVKLNPSALTVQLNVDFTSSVTDAPILTNKTDYSIIPYMIFEGDNQGLSVSYPIQNSNLPQITSIDTSINYYSKEVDFGAYDDILKGFYHSFGGDYDIPAYFADFQNWDNDLTVPVKVEEPGWYIVKWSTVSKIWGLPFRPLKDYCIRLVYLNDSIDLLIIDKYSGYNAYNFGVFKITDSKLIDSFNLEYHDCQPGMPIYDEEYIGQIALPHCFVLYEESKRFLGLNVKINNEQETHEGLSYRTVFNYPAYCYCFGYYTFDTEDKPANIMITRSQTKKDSMVDVVKSLTIKLLTNY